MDEFEQKRAPHFKRRKVETDQRLADRTELRPGDGLKAKILIDSKLVDARVFDISPTGTGLVIRREHESKLVIGSLLKIEFITAQQGDLWVKGRIKWKCDFKADSMKIGIEFQIRPGPDVVWPLDETFEVSEAVPILGAMYKPYLFYERTLVRVEVLSKNMWQIRVFDTEILAIPGIQFEIFISSTTGSDEPIVVEFAIVDSVYKGSALINVFPRKVPAQIEEWIAQQLVFGSGCTPEILRKVGFKVRNLANGLRFRHVRTQEEYEEVLKLRYLAYAGAGKILPGKTFADMVAPLDPISRIIAAYHGDKIIATVAVAFPESEETMLESESLFVNGYTRKIPPKRDLIEVSRLCTDPAYRQGDILIRIMEHVYKAMRCGSRQYVVTSTDDKLWPLYKKIGFRKMGMSYEHPYLAGVRHHMITQSADQADRAHRINPLAWNYSWRDMSSHLEGIGAIKRTGFARFKVLFLSWLGRLLRINLKKKY